MQHFTKLAAGLAAAMLVLSGCAKERPIKEVPKSDFGVKQESKDKIDTTVDYMFVASTLDSARRTSEARPHWMGEGQRVRFVWTEDALRVISPEEDGRFLENVTNANSVLTIPIEHVDYKCVEDEFGDCTRNEETNEEISWEKRNFFKLKPEELTAQQLEFFMPLDIKNWITGGGCFKDTATKLVDVKWEKDAVNIVLEKTYQGSPMCMNWADIEDLTKDFTFTVRYQYSFAKLSTLADPNYKAAQYTRTDEGNFGFFNTQRDRLDIDNNDIVDSRKWLFDRWNPNRVVNYYLGENFNKPEHKAIKKATYESFDAINNALEKAGTKMRLKLNDYVPGMSPADIRNNMIVMVEDPSGAGVIGYGPHVSNPLTGEILHARTVMYLGVIKKYIRYDYDHLIEELQAANAKTANLTFAKELISTRQSVVMPMAQLSGVNSKVAPASFNKNRIPGDLIDKTLNLEKLTKLPVYDKSNTLYLKDLKERIMMLSKHCEYPAELFNFENAIGSGIDEVIEEVGMKPWDALTEAEKAKVLDILIPYVWTPTLIHEVGHNLGLRHNFSGSEDVANFYTQAELKEMGVTRPFRYSSVMDYSYRANNQLHTMGKYDIAALRYGYAEKVELADGSLISLDEYRQKPDAELKPYSYCTDEHADVNPNCNRFDEGTNMAEIAQHYVRAYNKRYNRANFRNNRRKFSLMRDSAQMAALDDTFFSMRLMFERYEDIKNTFDLSDDRPEWQQIPFLKELKDAAVTAGHFYLNVLKTPDLMCAVSLASKPNEVIAVIPIRMVSKRAISCFDSEIQLNPQYVIVAEGGKNFQSRKASNNPNPYADEIDVRGIWIDKVLATQYLFSRTLGSSLFDDYTENMIHMPELQAPILETLEQMVTDDLTSVVTFRTREGLTVDFNVGYRLFDANPADNSHVIPPLLDDNAARWAGLSLTDPTQFHQLFIDKMLQYNASWTHLGMTEAMVAPYRVYGSLPRDGRESEYLFVDIGDRRYFARPQATAVQTLFEGFKVTGLLGQLTQEQLQKVMTAVDDTGLTEVEKAARALGPAVLQKYAQGGFQAQAYYALMIKNLAANFN